LTIVYRQPATLAGNRRRRVCTPVNGVHPNRERLGQYRTTLDGIGECAIVHRDAGDGAPFLPRDIYEALQFLPTFDALPLVENHAQLGLLLEQRTDDPMIG
jgi:hypothetical protein